MDHLKKDPFIVTQEWCVTQNPLHIRSLKNCGLTNVCSLIWRPRRRSPGPDPHPLSRSRRQQPTCSPAPHLQRWARWSAARHTLLIRMSPRRGGEVTPRHGGVGGGMMPGVNQTPLKRKLKYGIETWMTRKWIRMAGGKGPASKCFFEQGAFPESVLDTTAFVRSKVTRCRNDPASPG